MKERGILMSAPMARALMAGTKTQTRRAVRKQFGADATPAEVAATTPEGWQVSGHSGLWWDDGGACIDDAVRCPYGQPGVRLWVREAHRLVDCTCTETCRVPGQVWYEADASGYGGASLNRLRPSIHMPRWASRITLEVVSVRVERLQAISEADARAEGIETNAAWPGGFYRDYSLAQDGDVRALPPRKSYRSLWESINGAGSWDANPWVWAVEFRRLP